MISKQKIVSGVAALCVLGATLATVPAYAATSNTGGGNFFSGLIQYIAQKFGLDQNTVQSAVNDYKNQQMTTMQQTMQTREKAKLDNLVSQGKITTTQETAIINEIATLHSKYNPANFKNMTPDQRKQQFQQEQNDINSWAQSQGINPAYVMPFGRMGVFGHGGKGFGKWGNNPSVTPTP